MSSCSAKDKSCCAIQTALYKEIYKHFHSGQNHNFIEIFR